MKTFDNIIATTGQETRNAKGFALIELLTVVGIIAVLIGLLLPAIQKEREEYAAAEAEAAVRQLGTAANYYRNQVGEYPDSLTRLAQFVTANPSPGISIDPALASGKKNGYLYEVGAGVVGSDHAWGIIAEPEFPGITGSQTVTAVLHELEEFANAAVSLHQTPGADEAREQMFNRIRVKAAETVVKLLKLDASAISQARAFTGALDLNDLFILLDGNDDGQVGVNEIFDDPFFFDVNATLGTPLEELLAYAAQEMKLDSLSVEASAFFITMDNVESFEGDHPPLFSYDGLAVLTITTITDGTSNTLLTSLLDKLEAAEAAEASGDPQGEAKALKDYQKAVKGQIGQTITRSNANILITLAKML